MLAATRRRRLYLVRHGHVSYFDANGRPLPPLHVELSSQGLSQVRSLAAAMDEIRIDRIICSDLARARQTAQILAERIGPQLAPEARPAWREIRAGRLREVPAERLEAELAYAYDRAAQDDAGFVGGENFADFARRILDALQELLADPGWDSALVVSHDAVNRVLLCWAAGTDLGAMSAFEQDTACLNIVDVDWDGDQALRRLIRAVNFTAYDAVKTTADLTVMERIFRDYRSDVK
ncbi:histidine phosphatase family protein [Noviherbaspirillum sedimenti]|uniref:Histidine phosphatase family protein n=2 Tax=Noviherbaspirillum sedimenti TaxID=2320865 RepID=A0A3A3GBM8_9BURK|nr:histidine phosphatase family protein [Noviherbaspirillum sedimenti]